MGLIEKGFRKIAEKKGKKSKTKKSKKKKDKNSGESCAKYENIIICDGH